MSDVQNQQVGQEIVYSQEVGRWQHAFQVPVCVQLKSALVSVVRSTVHQASNPSAQPGLDLVIGAPEVDPTSGVFIANDVLDNVIITPTADGQSLKILQPRLADQRLAALAEIIIDPSEIRAITLLYQPAERQQPRIQLASR